MQLVGRLMQGMQLAIPPREALPGPDTAGFGGLDSFVDLMRHCWDQVPEERPSLEEIILRIK